MKNFILLFFTFLSINFAYSQANCANTSPICSGNIAPQPSLVGPNLGSPGCLGSAPNGNWYTFQTGFAGDLIFNLHQGNNAPLFNNLDIDFICWGPFTDAQMTTACNNLSDLTAPVAPNNIVDCSYSAAPVETITIPNANPGSNYILLITNFSGQPGQFVMEQTNASAPGAGSTNCDVVCGVDLGPTSTSVYPSPPETNTISICDSAITSQTLHCNFENPPANQATLAYKWYLDTGSGFQLQPGLTSKSITVTQSGTWKVVVTHPDCGVPSEDSVIIYFGSTPVLNTPPTQLGPLGDCNPVFDLTALIPALLAPLSPADFTVTFYTDLGASIIYDFPVTGNITNPSTFTVGADTVIYVRARNNTSPECIDTDDVAFLLDVRCTASATGNTICSGNNGQLTFSGAPGTVITFTEGPNTYNVTINAAGTFVWTTPTTLTGTTIYNLTNAAVGASNTPLNTTATITVIPQPTVTSFTGIATICSGSSTNLTFAGTPNTTITYFNGATNQTVLLDGAGNATVSVSPTVTTTYSLVSIATAGPPVCTNTATGSVVVTVTQQVSGATLSYAFSSFCNVDNTNYPPIITGFVDGTGSCSGAVPTYSATPAGLTINPTTGVINPFTSLPGTYTISVTYPACGNCPAYTTPVTISINFQPSAGSSGNTTVCDSDSTTIDLFSLITGEDTGGAWTRFSGTGGTFDAVAGTFIPSLGATSSVFNYTVAGTPPCSIMVSSVTVNINPQPQAGTDGSTTVCETSSAAIDLFGLITGEQSGGTWTRTGTGGTFNAAAGTFTPAVGATTSTFTYTLVGTAPCVNDTSVATVNINPQPIAGVDGSTTVCETSVVTINLYSLITGEQAGGTWTRTGTGGTFNAAAGTFTPAVGATTSTFTYTLTGTAPCIDDTSVATVNINAQPNAGTDGTTTVCASSTAVIDLFSLITGEQAGGTWTRNTGAGGTFDAVAGTYTPAAGATNSTFTYALIGTFPCINDASVATVNFTAQPDAGADGGTAICDNSTTVINLFSLITGEQAGGTWVRTSGTGGIFDAVTGTFTPAVGAITSTFTYTLTATAPCINDSSIATVTISAIPTGITISGSTTTCAGIPVNLTVTGTPGAVITWTGTPSSFTIGASGSNVISVSPTADTTYTLTSASLNGCTIPVVGQSATVMVSATPQFITQIPDITICNGGTLNIASQLTSTVPGATFIWSATTGNVNMAVISGDETNIDQVVNLINSLQNGTVNIEVKPQIGICSGASQQILVTVKPIPVITSTVADKTVICNNESVTLTSNSNPVATVYNWQINTATGVQIVGGATSGTSTTGIVTLQLALTNPLVAGTISFDFTPVNGICTGATITNAVTITVNPIPGTPIGLPVDEICSGETTNLTISSFPNIAGTTLEWTVIDSQNVTGFANGTGTAPFTINDVLVNTSNAQGYVIYSVTSKLGNCEGGTTEYTVLVNPLPKPNLVDGHICVNQTTNVTYQSYILDAQLSNPDFTYDWFVLNTTTGLYDALPSTNGPTYEVTLPGTYQVIVTNTVTNCQSVADQATVITVYPATAFTSVVTDAFTNNATITVTVNPIGTGNLIYSLDGGAWQSSNVFTGVEAGSHEIMVEDVEGCTNLTETVEVIDYPKYFTPNGDGIHDTWNVVGLNQADAKLYIFDRYGKLIKQLSPTEQSAGWDGTYNGQQAPSTDYWFTIDFTENNQQKQFKAHFSLKR